MRIDFAIMGAQKAGTTALYDMLKQHPEVTVPSNSKEDNFFVVDQIYQIGSTYLNNLYKDEAINKKVGYAYVNLMYNSEKVIPRLFKNNHNMKLIFVLRNPVDRAYSAFWYMKMRGVEESKTFEQAIEREKRGKLPDTFEAKNYLTYIAHGLYVDQISPFIEAFGSNQVKVVFQEELRSDYKAICKEIYEFIGVTESDFNVKRLESNVASQARSTGIAKLIYKDNPVKRIYKELIPQRIQDSLGQSAVKRLKSANRRSARYPDMDPETRRSLEEYFKPHDYRLEELLGRDLPWQTSC